MQGFISVHVSQREQAEQLDFMLSYCLLRTYPATTQCSSLFRAQKGRMARLFHDLAPHMRCAFASVVTCVLLFFIIFILNTLLLWSRLGQALVQSKPAAGN